jgi:hypothetical protein
MCSQLNTIRVNSHYVRVRHVKYAFTQVNCALGPFGYPRHVYVAQSRESFSLTKGFGYWPRLAAQLCKL